MRSWRNGRVGPLIGAVLGALVAGVVAASLLIGEPAPDNTVLTDALISREVGEPKPARQVLGPIEDDPPTAIARADVAEPSTDGTTDQTSTPDEPADTEPVEAPTAPESSQTDDIQPVTTQAPATTTTATPAATTAPAPAPAAPTTAAPVEEELDHGDPAAAPITIQRFTDWPIRNTSLDSRTQFVDTPASQLDWQQFTEGSDRAIALGSVTANKHLGQFRTQCSFSHFSYDDPIVNPGQPSAAHLHMYFGNTEANAFSTYESLRDSGSSTCNGHEGNRTAYWIPAVFDSSSVVRVPSRIEVYYKSHDNSFSIVEQPPAGLSMVAGRAANNPNVEWGCQETGAQGTNLNRPVQQRQNTIPRCSNNATLLAHISFPQCVGGTVTPTSGDHSSQMHYPTRGYFTNSCPAGTFYMTSIEYFVAWNPDNHDGNTDQWWLSSDVNPDGSRAPNGSTLHADWFGAWNPDLLDQIHDSCVSRLAECSWDLVNDHQRLTWIEHFGPKHPTAYTGQRTFTAEQMSTALCPGDAYNHPEDAANCDGDAPHEH